MLFNLLAESSASGGGFPWQTLLLWVFLIGALVALWFFSKRSQQKREKEIQDTLDAIQPGSKVKTIGGICGVVVEICPEDNTFILETGSEESGKSYIKFDKKAVYQTDAATAPQEEMVEEQPTDEEIPFEEVAETPVEETPVEETADETAEIEETVEVEETETQE